MIFRYPGAKNRLLPYIKKELYPIISGNNAYLEPFIGGGSVLLDVAQSFPNITLIANDLDQRIAAFWRVIKSDTVYVDRLIKMLDVTPNVDLFLEMREMKDFDDMTGAFLAVFFNRTTFSGILDSGPIGGYDQSGQYKINCRYNYHRLAKDIMAAHLLLKKRLVMFQQNALDMLANYQYPAYIDPPYFDKGDELYTVQFSRSEHELLSVVLEHKQDWVLSYDDRPEIREFYSYAHIQDIRASYTVCEKTKKTELIITPRKNGKEQLKMF